MTILHINFTVTTHTSGMKTYVGEMRHEGLNKRRIIRDTSENEEFIRLLAQLQWFDWEQQFEAVKRSHSSLGGKSTDELALLGVAGRDAADAISRDIQGELHHLETVLLSAAESNVIDWTKLKDKFRKFCDEQPALSVLACEPEKPKFPDAPNPDSWEYRPVFSTMDKLITSRRDRKIADASSKYQEASRQWQLESDQINEEYLEAQLVYRAAVQRASTLHAELTKDWEAKKEEFEKQERLRNAAIDAKQAAYLALDADAIVSNTDMVLASSKYPFIFPHEWELDYDPVSKQMIVDYLLPAPDAIPKIKGIKWIASRNVFEAQKLSETARTKLYDDVAYQTILRIAHEIIDADAVDAIHSIVVNGIVTSIDRGTGKEVTACILSLRVIASEFKSINLAQVDPKTCFKSLKGVGSAKLHGLSPVPPIMTIRKDDARFIAAYGVADSLDSSVNLASMGWEDFEHLIRELFQKEFSSSGGEVHVTQASRDGGVDAIAYDPDPIRGGKIVIQAKRYTNTVGVSAVRDLYGTVLNEGATKGVLVTTSDYGPDSYSFAQGKPLVLLNGANLLHMLEKHGHKARIDIREAKKHIAAQEL